MTTPLPSHIGRYEVLAPLGRGGMGVVYLARDETLEREVAIKVLPDEVATDPERLAWFEREARVLASLNHPSIATIHGFESSPDGTRFLVLERIIGETLAERLRRGPLAIKESLGIGLQIADALEAAHERGVVHRDLKPGNVMVTPRGRVKVLDFGMAKRIHSLDSSPENRMLGTPGYASPEQIRGEGVDQQADVFAFGCVLFECLAGSRAFGGPTTDAVIQSTLRAEPSWGAVPQGVPVPLQSFLARCLEKRADARPAGMGEASRILSEVAGIVPTPAGAGPPVTVSAPNNLPVLLTRFIGRQRDLAKCSQLLAKARLLTLIGVAGCGKTRLAIELAGRSLGDSPDRVCFVDLAPIRDGARILEAIAAAVGHKESANISLEEGVLETLRGGRTLLVLDNCEHLAAPVAVLAQRLLQACAGLRILATSREAIEIPGEQIFLVEPLGTPGAAGGARAALESEAVQLFLDRARRADPAFAVTEENVAAIAEICRRLDGIPLALELAAARVQLLTLDQIRSRLADRFQFLASPTRAATQHHRTLHAAIEWSHDQMVEVERAFFRRLAVFSGGWTLEAAAEVTGDGRGEFATLDLLTRLWNKSLVVVDRAAAGEPRYRYLETIREFALERLGESGEDEAIRDRHIGYMIALAEKTYPLLGGMDQARTLARLAPDHHNFLEALAWCDRAGGRDGAALRLASSLWNFWMLRCEYTAGLRALTMILDRPGTQGRTGIRVRALYGAGWLASLLGDNGAARIRMAKSLDIARELGDSKAVARALSGLGVVASGEGNYALAREYGLQSLELNKRVGNLKGMSAALNGLGNLAFRQGDFEASRTFMEEALSLHREQGDQEGIGGSLSNLAEVYLRLGLEAEARRALIGCLEASQAFQARHVCAAGLANCGKLASTCGDVWPAARLLGAAEEIWQATGYALEPADRADHEAVLSQLSALLGEERLNRARREGAALLLNEALEEALRYLRGPDSEAITL